jgi:hypothetical protein
MPSAPFHGAIFDKSCQNARIKLAEGTMHG